MTEVLRDHELLPAFRAVQALFRACDVDVVHSARLLAIPNDIYSEWCEDRLSTLSDETRLRLTALVSLHMEFRAAYDRSNEAEFWIRDRVREFRGRCALEVMLEEGLDGIKRIRRWLAVSTGATVAPV